MFSMVVRFHALVPAAGQGARSGLAMPKQYATLCGEPVLVHSVRALLRDPRIESVQVVLSPQDEDFARIDWRAFQGRVKGLWCGGASRSASVMNGLGAAQGIAPHDWVLVHDAARPCLPAVDLTRLIDEGAADPVGAILAAPVADTLKRSSPAGRIEQTVDRSGLWSALTPQMFRNAALLRALGEAASAGVEPTDEAAAMERLGQHARLVPGSRRNFKITFAEDFDLATQFLESQA